MRIAFLSDIHGNLEALNVALEAVERSKVDRVVCLGDVVGYGANPCECLELIRAEASSLVLGNHDAAVVNGTDLAYFNDLAREAAIWTQTVFSEEQKAFIRSLPLVINEDDIHLVHGTPRNPEYWDYIFSDYDAAQQFSAVEGRVCFVGHSHIPGVYQEDVPESSDKPKRIINVGSVGQPRDRDPRLCFAIYDTVKDEVEFIRQKYDIQTAAGKIKKAGLPEFLAERLFGGW